MAKVDTRLDAFGVNNSKVENSQISQGNQWPKIIKNLTNDMIVNKVFG